MKNTAIFHHPLKLKCWISPHQKERKKCLVSFWWNIARNDLPDFGGHFEATAGRLNWLKMNEIKFTSCINWIEGNLPYVQERLESNWLLPPLPNSDWPEASELRHLLLSSGALVAWQQQQHLKVPSLLVLYLGNTTWPRDTWPPLL